MIFTSSSSNHNFLTHIKMSEAEMMMRTNIAIMNNYMDGFDVVIVCCSSGQQARYWQRRLEDGRGTLLSSSCIVLAVMEDWPGGAGNALGTLYAYKNASALASERYGINIDNLLKKGEISVGLYHTAGKGTRLAPLPGAENNNKPGVKLPATIRNGSRLVPMTILEAVIKQTGSYAKSRRGRLSVFWGDQVFIPTVPVSYKVTHHIDILCSLGPMLSETEWVEKGMDKYGLIARNVCGDCAQVEKVDYHTAKKLLSSLGEINGVGVSLGSFSISHQMLFAQLDEFAFELNSKKGKMDSDPHLWMPMTLQKDDYIGLMKQKDVSGDIAALHFDRIANFLTNFNITTQDSGLKLFGSVDVGQNVYWWDYGQLKLYQRNAQLMSSTCDEAVLMRMYFGFDSSSPTASRIRESSIINTSIDSVTCVSSSHIGVQSHADCGKIKRSVLCNVRCKYIDAEDCILVNVTADRIIARPGSIVYNIVDESEDGLDLNHGQVLAGVFSDDGSQIVMRSSTTIDGGKAWEQQLEWNPKTFEDVYNMNTNADPLKIENRVASAHRSKWHSLIRSESLQHARDVGGVDFDMRKRSSTDDVVVVTDNVKRNSPDVSVALKHQQEEDMIANKRNEILSGILAQLSNRNEILREERSEGGNNYFLGFVAGMLTVVVPLVAMAYYPFKR